MLQKTLKKLIAALAEIFTWCVVQFSERKASLMFLFARYQGQFCENSQEEQVKRRFTDMVEHELAYPATTKHFCFFVWNFPPK